MPPEMLQLIAYGVRVLSYSDVVALAMASKYIHSRIMGTRFTRDLHASLRGASECLEAGKWRAARLALEHTPLPLVLGKNDVLMGIRTYMGPLLSHPIPSDDCEFDLANTAVCSFVSCLVSSCPGLEFELPFGPDRRARALFTRIERREKQGKRVRRFTYVDLAVLTGNVLALKLFLEWGESRGWLGAERDAARPVNLAAMGDQVECLDVLIGYLTRSGEMLDVSKWAFSHAGRWGSLGVLECLMKDHRVVQAQAKGEAALEAAAEHGHEDVVRFLLDQNVAPDSRYSYGLGMASRNGHAGIVSLLLEHGAHVINDSWYAVRHAVRLGHVGIIELMVEHGHVDVDGIPELPRYLDQLFHTCPSAALSIASLLRPFCVEPDYWWTPPSSSDPSPSSSDPSTSTSSDPSTSTQ